MKLSPPDVLKKKLKVCNTVVLTMVLFHLMTFQHVHIYKCQFLSKMWKERQIAILTKVRYPLLTDYFPNVKIMSLPIPNSVPQKY